MRTYSRKVLFWFDRCLVKTHRNVIAVECKIDKTLFQDLLAQLSVVDQLEMDKLNDDIRRLTQENKSAFATRMKLEAEKNKLENLLTNNLIRRRDELIQVRRISFKAISHLIILSRSSFKCTADNGKYYKIIIN